MSKYRLVWDFNLLTHQPEATNDLLNVWAGSVNFEDFTQAEQIANEVAKQVYGFLKPEEKEEKNVEVVS